MYDIKNFTIDELENVLLKMGEAAYRGRQLFSWIHQKGVDCLDKANNLPKPLVDRLKDRYYIGDIDLIKHLISEDRTEKFLFKLEDGNFIETVFIPSGKRATICLSSQVGCKFGCAFCASGMHGFARDLTPSEILSQILFLKYRQGHKATNYVFMGMGEPLDNYENVSRAILIMNDSKGLDIGARRITVSTCGVIPGIDKLKDLKLQVNLSISLHAVTDKLRDVLVPINKRYSIRKLIEACRKYIAKTKRLITLEYVLLKDKNDSLIDAGILADMAKDLNAKINLINYSLTKAGDLKPISEKEAALFLERLEKRKAKATLRISRGKDINAACGQLAGERRCRDIS
ncbi:MAG: 23S rRNA (adenine(2503)-C(2))-methyltransferase RlmN [Candidatus Omnitrophota bacterium]